MPVHVHGYNNNADIAQEFVAYFINVNFDINACVKAKHDCDNLCINHSFIRSVIRMLQQLITVELVDKCVHTLKLGKASGPDGLV
jgi:hypothetical protein